MCPSPSTLALLQIAAAAVVLGCAAPAPRGLAPLQPVPSMSPARDLSGSRATVDRSLVVETARRMLGRPYRYGGRTPRGFDCSGLIGYSYSRAGWRGLPRSARSLHASARPIELDELRPGDLLFFTFGGTHVSHVALYVGGGHFIHAPKTGGRVEQVAFDHPYWRRQLRLAGRLID